MKTNRTGEGNSPQKIENLKDGTFFYNFNIEKKLLKKDNSNEVYPSWTYDQVRLSYPVNESLIQKEITKKGFKHKVIL